MSQDMLSVCSSEGFYNPPMRGVNIPMEFVGPFLPGYCLECGEVHEEEGL